jgi:hypothetical protein
MTMTGPEYRQEAERLVNQAHHYTYGDGGDPVTGGALAAEAQVYATLALAAAQSETPDLVALREAVAELLHDVETSADDQLLEALARFRAGLPDVVLAMAEELMAALEYDYALTNADVMSADEMHEMDQAAEFAHDAAAELDYAADEAEEDDQR